MKGLIGFTFKSQSYDELSKGTMSTKFFVGGSLDGFFTSPASAKRDLEDEFCRNGNECDEIWQMLSRLVAKERRRKEKLQRGSHLL